VACRFERSEPPSRRGVAEVGEHEDNEDDRRDADAEILSNQVGEALSGDRAHTRAHLLRDDQRGRHRDEQPQHAVAELRSCDRIRGDPTDVVVGVGRDDPRPDDREEHGELPPERRPRCVGH